MRRLVFVALAAALAIATIAIGSRHDSGSAAPVQPRAAIDPTASADPPGTDPPLLPAARRFVTAFLAYESGDDGHAVRQAIRPGASRSLARQILARPVARGTRPSTGHACRLHLNGRRLPR